MATVFIFHGIGGSPEENWFPWLREKLTKKGHRVIVPQFPHADHPELQEWLTLFEQYRQELDEQSVLVGHSLGATFVLRLLEKLPRPVRASFLVAPVVGEMQNELDMLVAPFIRDGFEWEKIKKNAGACHLFHSDNDPFIALAQVKTAAQALGATFHLLPGAGHMNEADGFTAFEQLWKEMQPLLSVAKES